MGFHNNITTTITTIIINFSNPLIFYPIHHYIINFLSFLPHSIVIKAFPFMITFSRLPIYILIILNKFRIPQYLSIILNQFIPITNFITPFTLLITLLSLFLLKAI